MHRQADHVVREPFAHRQGAIGDREIPVGSLLMHRFRVVDRGRNALRFQRRGKTVAIGAFGQADGVLRPDRGAAGSKPRHGHGVAEAAGVAIGNRVAHGDLVLENFELLDQDRRLHGIEPRGQAETDVVVFVAALAVDGVAIHV